MRQIDIVSADPVTLPASNPGILSSITVKGPSYQFNAQSQILRMLWVHAKWIIDSNVDLDLIEVTDATLEVVLNPNKGANKKLTIPMVSSDPADSGFVGSIFPFPDGETWTHAFPVNNVQIRGDDMPNLGGIQIVKGGQPNQPFSVQLNFIYLWGCVANPLTGSVTAHLDFDVGADISDFSQAVSRRT